MIDENNLLKSEILNLRDLDWKVKEYETKINVSEKNLAQL